jgi:hypothetical protein
VISPGQWLPPLGGGSGNDGGEEPGDPVPSGSSDSIWDGLISLAEQFAPGGSIGPITETQGGSSPSGFSELISTIGAIVEILMTMFVILFSANVNLTVFTVVIGIWVSLLFFQAIYAIWRFILKVIPALQ